MGNDIEFSVVFPAFDEEDNLIPLIHRITKVMDGLKSTYEIVAVNNGSTDSSNQILRQLSAEYSTLKVLELTRNFGYEGAIIAGIEHTIGNWVIIMDGDQQDPPEIIPEFIEKTKEGFDIVYGVREKRPEGFIRSLKYKMFYRVWILLSEIDFPRDAGNFGIISRKAIDTINNMPERNKFFRGLRIWIGFPAKGLTYERDLRQIGKTKFPFWSLVNNALNGITSFSTKPLRIFTVLGVFGVIGCLLLSLFFILSKIGALLGISAFAYISSGFTTLSILILLGISINVLGIGLIGEYIASIFAEVKKRPNYIIKQIL